MEVEDDVFYADISKQITLLIMDDEDDEQCSPANCPSVAVQAFSHACYPVSMPFPLGDQQSIYRRESKGTGVFIPRSSMPRRKHRQGRFASFSNSSYKQPDRSRGVSLVTDRTNIPSNYSNPRVKET